MANGKDDIRVAIGWPRHFKRRALQRELGPAGPLALIDLWCFAGEHRPAGVFNSPDEVEVAVDWPKAKRGKLHAALVACGWIEADGVTLHDWSDEQPWIAKRPDRVAKAAANGAKGGAAKAANAKQTPSGPLAESQRNPSGPLADSSGRLAPLPLHSAPLRVTTPTPQPPSDARDPDAAAASASPPQEPGPDQPLASRLAARIRWATVATVAAMLDELRAEGDTDATLEAAYAATPDGRQTPYDWAKATRKRRGPTRATEAERADAERSALSWAERAREAERAGDDASARGAWGQVELAARVVGKTASDFGRGAPPDTDTTTAARSIERHAPLTCRPPVGNVR